MKKVAFCAKMWYKKAEQREKNDLSTYAHIVNSSGHERLVPV
ncbi:MAG: hypothetical protein ACD_56C00020G0003 [uncultured bacterium]|nr:MAG: hypothetical protein ACD_56C00020G0003 [uncultured bacterium]